jgi:hypothetical protein
MESYDFIEYFVNNPIELPKDVRYLSREEANERKYKEFKG